MLSVGTLLLTGLFAQRRQVMLDKVVAVVGTSSILYSEVDEYARQLVEQRRQEGYTSDRDPIPCRSTTPRSWPASRTRCS